MSASLKYCPGCKAAKDAVLFSRNCKRSDGLAGYCRDCASRKKKERRAAKPEETREQDRVSWRRRRAANKLQYMLYAAKARAVRYGLEFDLTLNDLHCPTLCPLLGVPLTYNVGGRFFDSSPSLDRIDPCRGYTRDNVWVISYRANRIKNDGTLTELTMIVEGLRRRIES